MTTSLPYPSVGMSSLAASSPNTLKKSVKADNNMSSNTTSGEASGGHNNAVANWLGGIGN
jgi:hypothetical protein